MDSAAPTQTGIITGVADDLAPVTAFALPWRSGEPNNGGGAAENYAAIADDPGNPGLPNMTFNDIEPGLGQAISEEFESAEFTFVGSNTASAETIDFSGANRQVLINGNGGADTILGSASNDTIKVPDVLFTSLNGGAGFDMVEFTAAAAIDDAALAKLSNIEAIKLGAGSQTILLTDTRVKALSGTTDALYIQGDATDTVGLNGGVGTGANQWHLTGTSNGLKTYVYFDASNAATTARVLIDAAITNVTNDNVAPTASSASANVNGSHTMSLADFNFADADGGNLAAVTINSTTGATGTLQYNGVAVSNGQTVTAMDVLAGRLRWSETTGPTTVAKTFDINYNVIDTSGLSSAAAATLTLNRSAAVGARGLVKDASGDSYFATPNGTGTLAQANVQAINDGGHLAIVNSAGELTALKNSVFDTGGTNTQWVNLVQYPGSAEPSGGWFWGDGTVFSEVWRAGEPNDGGGIENAGSISSDGVGAANMKFNDVTTISVLAISEEFESAEFTYVASSAASGGTNDFSGANRQVLINGNGGADTITGGSGNDTIKVPDVLFNSINGGAGFDLFEFTAAATINDAALAKLSNIEAIKLGTGAQDITLSDIRVKALSSTTDTLYIQGDGADTVHVNGGVGTGASQWHFTATNNGVNTYVYYDASNAATTARLLMDASITNVVV